MPGRWSRLAFSFFASVACAFAPGCASVEEDDAEGSAAEAFTVDRGDRFVIAARNEEVVLAKKVGGATFPFDRSSLEGKAILIHPVAGRADEGVYTRAVRVEEKADRYVIRGKSLSLEEMAKMKEDDVVRIFVDRRIPREAKPLRTRSMPLPELGTLTPQNVSTIGSDELGFSGFFNIRGPGRVSGSIFFEHHVERANLDTKVLLEWNDATGLDFGVDLGFDWKSNLQVEGTVSGEFFRSNAFEAVPFVTVVPIGIVPVPVVYKISASIVCSAASKGMLGATVDIEANARVAGSIRVRPDFTSPTSWFEPGPWPAHASGRLAAEPELATKVDLGVRCQVPRVELQAAVGGAAGPYIAFLPMVKIGTYESGMSAILAAGAKGSLLGATVSGEVWLLEWKPDALQ